MFPSDERYKKFISKLRSINRLRNLNLATGNCGIFAFALYETFKEGEIVDLYNCTHILLKHDNKYYDGERIYSYEDLVRSEWGQFYYRENQILDPNEMDVYDYIRNNTIAQDNKEFFEELIKAEFQDLIKNEGE